MNNKLYNLNQYHNQESNGSTRMLGTLLIVIVIIAVGIGVMWMVTKYKPVKNQVTCVYTNNELSVICPINGKEKLYSLWNGGKK